MANSFFLIALDHAIIEPRESQKICDHLKEDGYNLQTIQLCDNGNLLIRPLASTTAQEIRECLKLKSVESFLVIDLGTDLTIHAGLVPACYEDHPPQKAPQRVNPPPREEIRSGHAQVDRDNVCFLRPR